MKLGSLDENSDTILDGKRVISSCKDARMTKSALMIIG
jgi:hypothetical protein